MKKSKIILSVVLALVLVCTALVAVACHKHEFGGEWYADNEYHWQKATCKHTDQIGNRAKHTFQDGRCTVCGYTQDVSALLPYADNTTVRIAAGYNSADTGISFSAGVAKDGVKLSDGVTYHAGDLKPTWKFISESMKIKFDDKYTGESASKEFPKWKDQMNQVDIVAGTATDLQAAGAAGDLIDLAQYLNKMPNFRQYLQDNPIVRLSITGDVDSGAIYFSPYFDGVDDIERYPLIRADFVRTLLDGNTEYKGDNRALAAVHYEPYMPTTGTVAVESLNKDGSATVTITKDYTKYGNIIDKMNAETGLTGNKAVAMFREYIDKTYGGLYGETRSDLFLGYNACYDADELVALLRCGVASLHDNDGNPMTGLFPREATNVQRRVDMFRLAGHLFGVRGLESRSDYLYFGTDGKLHDARQDAEAYEAMERMHALVLENLVDASIPSGGEVKSENRLEKDAGMLSYDYNQTQTLLNNKLDTEHGEEYTVMMVPVAKWQDGTQNGVYMRFTESWRSVKTEGWALSKAGIGTDTNKLNAALSIIDYAFSVQGQITMSYGPDSFIKVKNADAVVNIMSDIPNKYETFNFNGQEWPVVSDGLTKDLNEREGGNYTNFARKYLGSTLNGFPKSQAFEYQCTVEQGKNGGAKVSAAIALGTVKHPLLSVNTENMWYTSVPTTLPHDQGENDAIKGYTNLDNNHFGSSKGNTNIFLQIMENGWVGTALDSGIDSPAKAAASVAGAWGNGTQYLKIKNDAWTRLLNYYNTLSK